MKKSFSMNFNLFFSISFLDIWIIIHANEQFHFGILNHHTQWHFHCPQNHTKILNPPSNDQPLISYECPHRSSIIEILPVEIDFTFLCRSQSRLVWIIIDLYQYNTYFWLIDTKNLEMKVELNHEILVNNSKTELKNYTNHFIIINAFYIPFESIQNLFNQPIEITIQIKNLNQFNQCQFLLKDNSLWETYLNQNCHTDPSKTFSIQHAQCDFYSNLQISDEKKPIMNSIEPNQTISYYPQYFLLEETYHQLLATLTRSTRNSLLLKLTFIFLLITLILLVLFFLYMLYYHYHLRSSTLITI